MVGFSVRLDIPGQVAVRAVCVGLGVGGYIVVIDIVMVVVITTIGVIIIIVVGIVVIVIIADVLVVSQPGSYVPAAGGS